MDKELKQINKKLDIILGILGEQSVKIDEVKKVRAMRESRPVFNPINKGKK